MYLQGKEMSLPLRESSNRPYDARVGWDLQVVSARTQDKPPLKPTGCASKVGFRSLRARVVTLGFQEEMAPLRVSVKPPRQLNIARDVRRSVATLRSLFVWRGAGGRFSSPAPRNFSIPQSQAFCQAKNCTNFFNAGSRFLCKLLKVKKLLSRGCNLYRDMVIYNHREGNTQTS